MSAGAGTTIEAGALPLALVLALAAGFVSFASPCVLPLVPGFLGYVTGLSDVALEKRGRGRLLLGALLFVLGSASSSWPSRRPPRPWVGCCWSTGCC